MSHTIITPKAFAIAIPLSRGPYQDALLGGHHSWAGSDLKGNAARNGGSYAASRDRIIERMRGAGLHVERTVAERGRIVVVVLTKGERRYKKEIPARERATAILARSARSGAIAKRDEQRAVRRAEREYAEDEPAILALA